MKKNYSKIFTILLLPIFLLSSCKFNTYRRGVDCSSKPDFNQYSIKTNQDTFSSTYKVRYQEASVSGKKYNSGYYGFYHHVNIDTTGGKYLVRNLDRSYVYANDEDSKRMFLKWRNAEYTDNNYTEYKRDNPDNRGVDYVYITRYSDTEAKLISYYLEEEHYHIAKKDLILEEYSSWVNTFFSTLFIYFPRPEVFTSGASDGYKNTDPSVWDYYFDLNVITATYQNNYEENSEEYSSLFSYHKVNFERTYQFQFLKDKIIFMFSLEIDETLTLTGHNGNEFIFQTTKSFYRVPGLGGETGTLKVRFYQVMEFSTSCESIAFFPTW